ncbi:MAG: hypothetical protein KDA91_22225 [Planctomycetaceae bacterium]|nr:hypothetical protein [Planctomycetaceae bacterium]
MKNELLSPGGLRTRVIDDLGDSAPKLMVILCHGFGASGDDLVPVAEWLIDSSDLIASTCQFACPEAPVDLTKMGMPGARAWWPINMALLAEINQTRNYQQLTELTPDGMLTATEQLNQSIKELLTDRSLSQNQVVLGGFSQGAMCSTDVVLRHGFSPAMLALFSGTMLCREDWTNLAKAHPGCQVFQSHGQQDMVLPFRPAVELSQMLFDADFRTEFHEFQGGHTIPASVLHEFSESLSSLLG